MSVISRKDFCEKYGIQTTSIPSYVRRHQLIIDDGFINTSLKVNQIFIEKRLNLLSKKKIQQTSTTPPPQQPDSETQQPDSETKVIDESAAKIITEKDILRNKSLEEDFLRKKMDREIREGKYIETEFIIDYLNTSIKSLIIGFQQTGDAIGTELASITGGDRLVKIKVRERIRKHLDKTLPVVRKKIELKMFEKIKSYE